MPEPGNLIGNLIGLYFLVLGGFAAIAAATAIQEDDREGLAGRVFWSLTKTTLFLGFPALVGFLIFLDADSPGDGGGGIMSKNMGLFVLFFIGALGLFGLWLGCITLGFVASLVARKLPPLAAGAVVLAAVALGPVLMAGVFVLEGEAQRRERLRRGARSVAPVVVERVLGPA